MLLGGVLSVVMTLSLFSAYVHGQEQQSVASPTAATVMIDGVVIEFESYTINDRNFFRLRDIAYALNGTQAQFNVEWDEAAGEIVVTRGVPYVPVGGEMAGPAAESRTVTRSPSGFRMGTGLHTLNFVYNIDGSHFFELRSLAAVIGFDVGWEPVDRVVIINTMPREALDLGIPEQFLHDLMTTGTADMYSLAIRTDGSLWGWVETLDRSFVNQRTQPQMIKQDVISAAVGNGFAFAVTSDGVLWGWGWNEHGLLGDGTRENRHEPVRIMDEVVYVASNASGGSTLHTRTYALRRDGSLWGWGWNAGIAGQEGWLGDGTTETRYEPVWIMDNVASFSLNADIAIITTDGGLYILRQEPIRMLDDVVMASSSGAHHVALRGDGSVWVWGLNDLFSSEVIDAPTRVMDNAISVATSGVRTIVTLSDGSLWSWNAAGTAPDARRQFRLADGLVEIPEFILGFTRAITASGELWIHDFNEQTGVFSLSEMILDSVREHDLTFMRVVRTPDAG